MKCLYLLSFAKKIEPKTLPRQPKLRQDAPGCAKKRLKLPQDTPKKGEFASRMPPKTAPKQFSSHPRHTQDAPRHHQDGPRASQAHSHPECFRRPPPSGFKVTHDTPKTSQDTTKMAREPPRRNQIPADGPPSGQPNSAIPAQRHTRDETHTFPREPKNFQDVPQNNK